MKHIAMIAGATIWMGCRIATPMWAQSPLPTPRPTPTGFVSTPTPEPPEPPIYWLHLPMVAAPGPLDAERDRTEMDAIHVYIQHVAEDGDYLNDWLTHVRPSVRDELQALGHAIAD